MRAMNLYLVTRAESGSSFSMLARELTGNMHNKDYSIHEADSLRSLVDALMPVLRTRADDGADRISYLDGFYFSFTIAHISKEFDLLKISGDGECVLNIELKSENIEESRIIKQLSQNRYYLSHISNTIYSFTYVMETNTLYNLNEKGYMRVCSMEDLADVICRQAFSGYVEKDLDLYFRASDYLISPAAEPEKFLQGNYFLTNQQSEFKRKILEMFSEAEGTEDNPVVDVRGTAGTGKTLLLFDVAMALSRKKRVLILTGGIIQEGHRVIDERLRNVFIRSADGFTEVEDWNYLFVDEANRISPDVRDRIMGYIKARGIPCIMAHDPHTLMDKDGKLEEAEKEIEAVSSVLLEFTGNIRINRPVYSFLQRLFHQSERPAELDYNCIEVLYAGSREEAFPILAYYSGRGYHKITLPGGGPVVGEGLGEEEIIGLEFDCVSVILDGRFYYDEEKHLRCRGERAEEALNLLYEGISRTREKMCILVMENRELFDRVLALREF